MGNVEILVLDGPKNIFLTFSFFYDNLYIYGGRKSKEIVYRKVHKHQSYGSGSAAEKG